MKNALNDASALHKTTLFMIIQKVSNIIKLRNRKALKMLFEKLVSQQHLLSLITLAIKVFFPDNAL